MPAGVSAGQRFHITLRIVPRPARRFHMTLDDELLGIINQAASIAAEAAIDAFGKNVPPAHVAWDFLEQLYESEVLPRPERLPLTMPPGFRIAYEYHCATRTITGAYEA